MNTQFTIFEFGRFRLDTEESRLTRDGEAIALEPQVLKTLKVLVENSGHLCEKGWLIEQVWGDTIVEEGNLARNISVLRKALGDRENGNHFIETVPKRGYRFVAAVTANGQYHEALVSSAKEPQQSATWLVRRKRWLPTAILVGGAFAILTASLFLRKANSGVRGTKVAPSVEFTQLTNALGEEAFPSLSPDGKFLVYTSSAGGSADNWSGNANIYLLKIGSNKPINLTGASPGNGSAPAFSPDGSLIAFRSEKDGGGIFVMDADGENLKRLTEFGAHPSWSPDQSEIVFATDDTWSPLSRKVNPSELWLIKVATGEKRRLATPGDAAQPSWSPHGHRVAFWGQNRSGAKNIFTINAYGGEPVVVTNDSFVNWNPVWSPDGSYIYFASDRGGSMNLWRVQIDEKSGAVDGSPTPVTTPSSGIGHLCFSRDGRHLAYVSATNTANIAEVSFDSQKEVVIGEPKWVTRVTTSASMPNLSPDGHWLAYGNLGDKEEDIFVIRTDGTELRQITSDSSKDRRPRWSPDGKRIAFDSDRGGKLEIWIVNSDGSEASEISSEAGPNMVEPVWAPDGKQLAFRTQGGGASFIAEFGTGATNRPTRIAAIPGSVEEDFRAHSWTPDGKKLAGWSYRRDSSAKDLEHKLCIYSFDTHRFEKLDVAGVAPNWLSDNRRLIFAHNGELFLLDTESKKTHKISTLDASGGFSVSADGRKIYLSVASYQADIWMMNLP